MLLARLRAASLTALCPHPTNRRLPLSPTSPCPCFKSSLHTPIPRALPGASDSESPVFRNRFPARWGHCAPSPLGTALRLCVVPAADPLPLTHSASQACMQTLVTGLRPPPPPPTHHAPLPESAAAYLLPLRKRAKQGVPCRTGSSMTSEGRPWAPVASAAGGLQPPGVTSRGGSREAPRASHRGPFQGGVDCPEREKGPPQRGRKR